MNEKLDIKNIVSLITRLQNLCEGFNDTNKNVKLSINTKILLEISKRKEITPSELKTKVGLAKSNLANFCQELRKKNLIEKKKDTFDSREILFSITPLGVQELDNTLKKMQTNFETELAYKNNLSSIKKTASDLMELVE